MEKGVEQIGKKSVVWSYVAVFFFCWFGAYTATFHFAFDAFRNGGRLEYLSDNLCSDHAFRFWIPSFICP